MSTPPEPSVESLTAMVRVLRVGARQVTLSAARQLDHVDPAVIQPLGRVRISAKPAPGLIEVIGPDEDGFLVRSSANRFKVYCPGYEGAANASSWATGRSIPQDVCADHRNTPVTDAAGLHHAWTKYTPDSVTWETWLDLPLIVLAGLR
jgi:hypothetical protein